MAEDISLLDVQLGLTPEQLFDFLNDYGVVTPIDFPRAGDFGVSMFEPDDTALSDPNLKVDPALLSYLDTVFVDERGNLVNADGRRISETVRDLILEALGSARAPVPAGQEAGQTAASRGLQAQAIDPAEFENVVQSLTPEEQAALNRAIDEANAGGGMARILKGAEDFTGTNIGRILATLALGATGLGIARAVAGGAPEIRVPGPAPLPAGVQAAQQALTRGLTTPSLSTSAPLSTRQAVLDAQGNLIGFQNADGTVTSASAATTGVVPRLSELAPGRTGQEDLEQTFRLGVAGQRNLSDLLFGSTARELQTDVEQAPQERAVRQAAITGLPEMLVTPGAIAAGQPVTPMADPIRDAIRAELTKAFAGDFASPALERRLGREEEAVRNRLRMGLGNDYELSTAGIQGVNEFNDYANTLREEERRRTISSWLPQEESRSRFAVTFPEDVRRSGVNERLTLSNFGRRTAPQLTTSLSSMVPVQPLLGLGDAAAAARQQEALQTQAALTSFGIENENRRALSQGIGGLVGTAAAIGLAPRTLRLSDGRVGELL